MARRVGFGDKDRNETRRDAERWDRPSREGRAERKERLERERAERRARSEAAHERPTTGESAVGRARGSRGAARWVLRGFGLALAGAWAVQNLGGLDAAERTVRSLLNGDGDPSRLIEPLTGPAILVVALLIMTQRLRPRRKEPGRSPGRAPAPPPRPAASNETRHATRDASPDATRKASAEPKLAQGQIWKAVGAGLLGFLLIHPIVGFIIFAAMLVFFGADRSAASPSGRDAEAAYEGFEGAAARRATDALHRDHPEAAEGFESDSPTGRVVAGVFLAVWLIAWTGGLALAVGAFLDGSFGADWFLGLWIVLAAIGWVFAARTLFSLIRGDRL